MSAESLPPLPSDTPPSVPTAAIGNNPTNANKSTNKDKDKDPYANRDPFPLVKNYDSLPIIPHDALPLEQNKYNKNWVLCTQHILPALTGKSYEDYNPFDEKDTQNRINDGLEVLKKLNEIGLEHLQKAIGELFNKKGKKSSTNQKYPTAGFDKIVENMVSEFEINLMGTLQLLYEIVFVTIDRDQWKDAASREFMKLRSVAVVGNDFGMPGSKKRHCFIKIAHAAASKSIKNGLGNAMDRHFKCSLRTENRGGSGVVGWGVLPIEEHLLKSSRSSTKIYIRFMSKEVYEHYLARASSTAKQLTIEHHADQLVAAGVQSRCNLNQIIAVVQQRWEAKFPPVQGQHNGDGVLSASSIIGSADGLRLAGDNLGQDELLDSALHQLEQEESGMDHYQASIESLNKTKEMLALMAAPIKQQRQQQQEEEKLRLEQQRRQQQQQQEEEEKLRLEQLRRQQQQQQHEEALRLEQLRRQQQKHQEEEEKLRLEQLRRQQQQQQHEEALRLEQLRRQQQQQQEEALRLEQLRSQQQQQQQEEEKLRLEQLRRQQHQQQEKAQPKNQRKQQDDTASEAASFLAEQQRKEEAQKLPQIGEVGYEFKKYFPRHGWFNGVVMKVYTGEEKRRKYVVDIYPFIQPIDSKVSPHIIFLIFFIKANGKNCVCHYSDGDTEDLSIADLRSLKKLVTEEHKGSAKEKSGGLPKKMKVDNQGTKTAATEDDVMNTDAAASAGVSVGNTDAARTLARFLANVAQPKQKHPSTSNTSEDTVGIGTVDDIDTGKVQIWSCANAEKRGNTCLQSVCDTCYLKKEEAPNTRGKRETEQSNKVAKVVGGKSCNLDHDKQITFKHADLQYIVGPWADQKRKLKSNNHLPVSCAKCGGKFV